MDNIYKLTFDTETKRWSYSRVAFETDFQMPGEKYDEISFGAPIPLDSLDETVKFVRLSDDEVVARLVNRWNRDLATGYREIHTCKDCGKIFFLNAKEKDWYTKKKYQLPKRCKACRASRRADNA